MQTGLTGKRREHMTLQGFPCHHIKKKKCDRSNFIHVIWFTESKSESLGRKTTQRKVP